MLDLNINLLIVVEIKNCCVKVDGVLVVVVVVKVTGEVVVVVVVGNNCNEVVEELGCKEGMEVVVIVVEVEDGVDGGGVEIRSNDDNEVVDVKGLFVNKVNGGVVIKHK
jgi:hypothetical protein